MMATSASPAREQEKTEGPARNVLFITYDFPPRRTSAVYRFVGLMKYVVRFGWRPTVLTVGPYVDEILDNGLAEELPPELTVVRTARFEPSRLENSAATAIKAAGGLHSQEADPRQSWVDKLIRRIGRFVRSTLYFPDQTVAWIPIALIKAIQLRRKRHFDVIYTSSPPRTAPVVGLLLKAISGLPWVAEFRDPWHSSKSPLRPHERWLLRLILRAADRVVLISEGLAEELQRKFGVPRNKITVLPNGYDEAYFESKPEAAREFFARPDIQVSHFGTVYPGYCGAFFPALAELVQEFPEVRQRLRINIIGFPDDPELRRYSGDKQLCDVIQLRGFVEQREAIEAMRESDCLLLFLGNPLTSRLSGLGKIYWYLRVGRPVLAIAPEGSTKDLIEQAHAGWVIDPGDKQAIKEALLRIVQKGHSPIAGPCRPDFVEQFRYDRLAARLAEVFNEVARP